MFVPLGQTQVSVSYKTYKIFNIQIFVGDVSGRGYQEWEELQPAPSGRTGQETPAKVSQEKVLVWCRLFVCGLQIFSYRISKGHSPLDVCQFALLL